ncbi:MAG: hypothetical protein AB1445_03980 [Bacillota bacterium]
MFKRRLGRILRPNGRSLIVAVDHAVLMGPARGLEKPGKLLEAVVDGGADAVLTTFGVARNFGRQLAQTALILRADGGSTMLGQPAAMSQIYSVEAALQLGAEAVACMGFPGSRWEGQTLPYLAALAAECDRWGMALMAETLPRGFEGGDDARTPGNLKLAARIGAELGADFIKTQYPGTVEAMREMTETCYVPVVVLGGSRMETDRQCLEVVRAALDGGAAGVAMGRNIWQHPEPAKMTRALAGLIHHDLGTDEAMALAGLKG